MVSFWRFVFLLCLCGGLLQCWFTPQLFAELLLSCFFTSLVCWGFVFCFFCFACVVGYYRLFSLLCRAAQPTQVATCVKNTLSTTGADARLDTPIHRKKHAPAIVVSQEQQEQTCPVAATQSLQWYMRVEVLSNPPERSILLQK